MNVEPKNYYIEYLMPPKYAVKICDMHTLLKYAKIRQSAKYAEITYSRFSDMPTIRVHNPQSHIAY